MFHVLRYDTNQVPKTKQSPTQVSSFVELLNIIDTQTRDGAYLSIQDIENTYVSMLLLGGTEALENHSPAFTRQWLKDRILSELPHVKSVRQRNMRSPAVLYYPEACDADMLQTAIRTADDTESMKHFYQTARLLRQRIEQFTKKVKTSSSIVVTSTLEHVPVELYTMIRWIMAGPADKLQTEVRTTIVDRGALTLSQNLMLGFKSKRQVTYKPSDEGAGFRSQQAREKPQLVGLALTIHHDTTNKKRVNLLNAQGHCASYSRALIMETALANAVVENTKQFQGLYVPPFLKKGAFVFFASDNTDFAEDTADGKGTTHGTVIAVYQKADAPGEPITPPLRICETKSKSLLVTPYHTAMLPCEKSQKQLQRRSGRGSAASTTLV